MYTSSLSRRLLLSGSSRLAGSPPGIPFRSRGSLLSRSRGFLNWTSPPDPRTELILNQISKTNNQVIKITKVTKVNMEVTKLENQDSKLDNISNQLAQLTEKHIMLDKVNLPSLY
ncbi:hypothetical protein AA313_de0207964 [Arthrobotrys entomopaga]|nr:hypothetical protein AA313_de0207964 [Arthrobotrys entomopaga]